MKKIIGHPLRNQTQEQIRTFSTLLREMHHLGETKSELRSTLTSSELNKTGRKILDNLLSGLESDGAVLWDMSQSGDLDDRVLSTTLSAAEGAGGGDAPTEAVDIAAGHFDPVEALLAVDANEPFNCHYYDNQHRGWTKPIDIRGPDVNFEAAPTIERVRKPFSELDGDLARALDQMTAEIDFTRFRKNFK